MGAITNPGIVGVIDLDHGTMLTEKEAITIMEDFCRRPAVIINGIGNQPLVIRQLASISVFRALYRNSEKDIIDIFKLLLMTSQSTTVEQIQGAIVDEASFRQLLEQVAQGIQMNSSD